MAKLAHILLLGLLALAVVADAAAVDAAKAKPKPKPKPKPTKLKNPKRSKVSAATTAIRAGIQSLQDQGDGQTAPVCSLATQLPQQVQPQCPDGTTAGLDSNGNFVCYGDCSTLDDWTVSYAPSGDGSMCVPQCPSGSVQTANDGTTVTCASCPWGYSWSATKNTCLETCGSGSMSTYPYSYDNLSPTRCSAKCPALFPIQKSFNQCANSAGRTTFRSSVTRRSQAARIKTFTTAPRPTDDLTCGASNFALEDETGTTQCYACPNGQVLSQDGAGYAVCTDGTCIDGFSRCGIYCWNNILDDGMGYWDDDYCAAFLDTVVGCMPACSDLAAFN